jgi:hypothetical protein
VLYLERPTRNSGYGFKHGNQSRIVSLQEAVEHKGFDFWYLDIQVDLQPGVLLLEKDVLPPSVMQWLPIDYGSGVEKAFKFKHIQMKTRERYEIQLLHPLVPATVLRRARKAFDDVCLCSSQHLLPIPVGVWEWRQPFGCVLCGQRYFCDCFRTDGQDARNADLAATSASTNGPVRYRSGICHLCTGTPSALTFCHPMYGSAIKVRYGAYIEKFAIAEGLLARDAENKVRDMLGVPRIGEGWISETQLFKLVKLLFADYEVIREARFDWLGGQRIDIFIPAVAVAIEYQGEQHFRPVGLFGGEVGFREAQLRDKLKRQLCKSNGVKLIYFTHSEDLSVEQVEKKLKKFLPDTQASPNKICASET